MSIFENSLINVWKQRRHKQTLNLLYYWSEILSSKDYCAITAWLSCQYFIISLCPQRFNSKVVTLRICLWWAIRLGFILIQWTNQTIIHDMHCWGTVWLNVQNIYCHWWFSTSGKGEFQGYPQYHYLRASMNCSVMFNINTTIWLILICKTAEKSMKY